jgi:hypothetical protein
VRPFTAVFVALLCVGASASHPSHGTEILRQAPIVVDRILVLAPVEAGRTVIPLTPPNVTTKVSGQDQPIRKHGLEAIMTPGCSMPLRALSDLGRTREKIVKDLDVVNTGGLAVRMELSKYDVRTCDPR